MLVQNTGGLRPIQARSTKVEAGRAVEHAQYDRVEFSSDKLSQEERFAHDVAARISQELRAPRTEEVNALSAEVASGNYHYTIEELAAQIALFGGPLA